MKRREDIIFGGYFAFSGGKVEEQDHYEHWLKNYPEMFEKFGGRKFYDFNARVCAIRETFEEINLLITKPIRESSSTPLNMRSLGEVYSTKYQSNFLDFCRAHSIIPDFE